MTSSPTSGRPDHLTQQRETAIATANATFAATLVDELVRLGVRHAVVCPGSRSTPLALAFAAAEPSVRVHIHHDERSAGFLALGLALPEGDPTAIVTTSGTAAVELHPSIVEAHHARVPLIVLTADRPPELQDVGAPQTIDQTHLYGTSVRWFAEPGPPDAANDRSWRPLAARAVAEALGSGGGPPGPVHLNLGFREPLAGTVGSMPPARNDSDQAWRRTIGGGSEVAASHRTTVEAVAASIAGKTGVIVAGGYVDDADGVQMLAERLSWPVLADARSGCRTLGPTTVAHFDSLLRVESFVETMRPQVVLRLGAPPASKVLGQWLAGLDAWQLAVETNGILHDPDHSLAAVVRAEPGQFCRALAAAASSGSWGSRELAPGSSSSASGYGPSDTWLDRWVRADANAAEAIAAVLGRREAPTEPGTARAALLAVPDGGNLFVSSSMPIRDLEWFGPPREHLRVFANRGANGIDGVVSSALGVALATNRPTALLIGDVAFLHDSNGLLGAARRTGADLTVVVVDNDGGGIFEFLPQAGALDRARFERLFGTPHGVDLAALAEVHGATVHEPATAVEVGPAVQSGLALGGLHVVIVRTDREANVALHHELNTAVAQSLFRSR